MIKILSAIKLRSNELTHADGDDADVTVCDCSTCCVSLMLILNFVDW